MNTGIVYLVGAGPGDPGLITQKGIECLARADVVVYDFLVNEHLLELARTDAEKICVGKKRGHHSRAQSAINRLLVDKAKQGKTIVRLKGGDPFVFGRGGEEAEELAQNGIPFQIVPGISSAIAVPAYAGIPVTHRNMSSSFAVITGHESADKDHSTIDWEKISSGADTLVFLMGRQNLPEIINRLIQTGRNPDTPVAIIENGTSTIQKTVIGTLKNIIATVKKQNIEAPVVIVVGEVVDLRETLSWFDTGPLFGKRVLVTRARQQASSFSKLLIEHGAQPVELPVISIQPTDDIEALSISISNLQHYHWILFTSVNGVESFFKYLYRINMDARVLKNLNVGAIGPATANALKERGIIPDFIPDVFTSEGIISGLANRKINGKHFLLPRTDIADRTLADGIRSLGAEVHEVVAYKTVSADSDIIQAKELLSMQKIDVITFTSSSTVINLIAVLGGDISILRKAKIACIGPRTAATASKAGAKVDIIAKDHTLPGLVAAIEEYFRRKI